FHLGFGSCSLWGHNPPDLVAALHKALSRNTGAAVFNPAELTLCQQLRELLPFCSAFAFLNSGSEANRAAVLLAKAFTGRRLIAKFSGALHGNPDFSAHNT